MTQLLVVASNSFRKGRVDDKTLAWLILTQNTLLVFQVLVVVVIQIEAFS